MLIYYTGIKNIDPVLYEAASIDGAGWWRTFFSITLPLMKPVIQINDNGDHFRIKTDGNRIPADKWRTEQ